jgi:hypothetical protein
LRDRRKKKKKGGLRNTDSRKGIKSVLHLSLIKWRSSVPRNNLEALGKAGCSLFKVKALWFLDSAWAAPAAVPGGSQVHDTAHC